MLRAFLERRRIQKTFARFVSPDVARQIADGSLPAPSLSARAIEFAFVVLSASDAPSYSERAGSLAEVAFRHGATVHCLLPVVVVAFGVLDSDSPAGRSGFVAALQSQFSDAAVVHGAVTATVGPFGGPTRLDVGFWWPDIADALQQLARLSPGEAHEFRRHESI